MGTDVVVGMETVVGVWGGGAVGVEFRVGVEEV